MSKADLTARNAALTVFRAVLRQNRALDDALDAETKDLDDRDRAFARMLTGTALRRLGQIDALIRRCLDKALPPKAALAQDILRLGVAQLVFMDVPDHAAVDTAVRLAVAKKQGPYKKLINAILRRIGREGEALLQTQDPAKLNTPEWLWDAWTAQYGDAVVRAIAEAHLTEAPLDISTKGAPADWVQPLNATLLPTGSLRRDAKVKVTELPGFAEGAWWVQDAAAALPVTLLGDIKGLRVADLCAAPGGKTAQLAARGAQVTAVDRSEKRLTRLRGNMARLHLSVETLAGDATRIKTDRPFDAVLLDAPCSATGTIRRHPDVARLKRPKDLEKLATLQAAMLRHAFDLVKPGGLVVYCVCSLQAAEGEDQIDSLLTEETGVERVPVTATDLPGLEGCLTEAGDVRTLPSHLPDQGGLDGFFVARLRKKGGA